MFGGGGMYLISWRTFTGRPLGVEFSTVTSSGQRVRTHRIPCLLPTESFSTSFSEASCSRERYAPIRISAGNRATACPGESCSINCLPGCSRRLRLFPSFSRRCQRRQPSSCQPFATSCSFKGSRQQVCRRAPYVANDHVQLNSSAFRGECYQDLGGLRGFFPVATTAWCRPTHVDFRPRPLQADISARHEI